MPTNLAAFKRLFVSRQDAFPKASQGQGWRRINQNLTDLDLEQHFLGVFSLGSYLLDPTNDTARVLVFDIDRDDKDLAFKIANYCLEKTGYGPVVEATGGRGWHVWLCFDSWEPAARLRAFGQMVASALQLDADIEIYPKSARVTEAGFGTQVRLPLGKHHRTGRWSQIYDVFGEDVSEEDYLLIPASVLPTDYRETSPRQGGGGSLALPCYQTIERGVDEGCRDEAMFALACRYRDLGASPAIIQTILETVNSLNRPPLPLEILREKVDSAFQGLAHIGCSSPILQRFCNPDHCKLRVRKKQLRTWRAKDLLTTEIPPLAWVVYDIFPHGLGILAGKPKLGKSWMALSLSAAVATGSSFLGHETEPGPVLYLALEDGPARLQQRLRQLNVPAEAQIQFELNFPRFGGGDGIKTLVQLLDEGYDGQAFNTIIMDSLAAAKSTKAEEVSPEDMEKVVRPLQTLSRERECLVLLVHHHRKSATGDVIWDVRGSGALVGIADVSAGLYESEGRYRFVTRSRDAKEVSYWLTFDNGIWRVEGTTQELGDTQNLRDIVSLARAFGDLTAESVAVYRGVTERSARRLLNLATDRGLLEVDRTVRPFRFRLLSGFDLSMEKFDF